MSVVSVKMRGRCPPPSSSCTASPGRGAPGIRWLRGWIRNAIRPWRPTCAATAPRATRARSASPPASPTCSPSPPSASTCAATRWAGGSRCTSRWRRPSASSGSLLVATTAGTEDAARPRRAPRRRRGPRRLRRHGDDRAVRRSLGGAAAVRRHAPRRRPRLARGPAAQRPARAGRLAAGRRQRRDGAALGAPGRAHDARHACWSASATRSSSRWASGWPTALPNAELVVVPGAGHGLPREAPEAIAAALGA